MTQPTPNQILKKFPKKRPPLPAAIKKIYHSVYKENRDGNTPASSVTQRIESWLHFQVAKDINFDTSNKLTLEIGAGTLNQLKYETKHNVYDIVEPFKELYESSEFINRIRHIYSDISVVPPDAYYDRITSIATFEHICNLPEVIARSALLLKKNGVLRVAIPSEGTVLWKLGWKLTTGLEFRLKYGLDYGLLMKHEHVNSAREIEILLTYFFNNIEMKIYGISRYFSLYQFFSCSFPDIKKCVTYLNKIKG